MVLVFRPILSHIIRAVKMSSKAWERDPKRISSFLVLIFAFNVWAGDDTTFAHPPLILAQVRYEPGSKGDYPTKTILPWFMFENEKWVGLEERLARKSRFDHKKKGEPIPSVTAGLPPFPAEWLSYDKSERVKLDIFTRAVFNRDESILRHWYLPSALNDEGRNSFSFFAKDAAQIVQPCAPGWVLDAEPTPDEPSHLIESWVSNQPVPMVLARSIESETLPNDVRERFLAIFKEEEAWQLAQWAAGANANENARRPAKIPASIESLQARELYSWKGASLVFPDGAEIFSFEIIKTYKDFSPDSCENEMICSKAELCLQQAPFTFQGFGVRTQDGLFSMLEVKSWYGKCGEGNRPGADKELSAGIAIGGRNYLLARWYGLEASGTTLYQIDQKNWIKLATVGSGC